MTATAQQTKPTTTTAAKPSDTPILDKILSEGVTYKTFGTERDVHLVGREAYEAFALPTTSGKMPTRAHLSTFLKTCEASRLDPWARDAFLIGYDTQSGPVFNTIVAHQSFLKRAEVNKAYRGMESGVIVRTVKERDEAGEPIKFGTEIIEREGDFVDIDEIVIGGWAKVYREDRTIPCYRRARLSIYTTGKSRWKADPGGMICKVAEADALRSSFPNVLGGLYISEEFDKDEASGEATYKPPIEEPKRKSDKTKEAPAETLPPVAETPAPVEEPTDERQTLETALAENLDADPVETKPNANHPNRGIAESKTEKMLAGIAKCKNHEQLKAVQAKCKPVLDSMKKDGFTDLLATVAQAFKDCEDLIEMDLT